MSCARHNSELLIVLTHLTLAMRLWKMDYYHLYCTDEEIEASRGGGTRPPSQVLCVQVQSWDRNPGSRLLGHAPSPTLGSSLVSGSIFPNRAVHWAVQRHSWMIPSREWCLASILNRNPSPLKTNGASRGTRAQEVSAPSIPIFPTLTLGPLPPDASSQGSWRV